MKAIVMLSGGVSSFIAAARAVERYGRDAVELWFADTRTEDADLYRFLDDCAGHLQLPLTRLCDGRDVWQLFMDEGMIANSRAEICSRVLKRDVLNRERARWFSPDACVTVFGIDYTEIERAERIERNHAPYRCWFPLLEPPRLDKCAAVNYVNSLGIQPPRLTLLGMPHNNCGGFCVKAGQGHFANLYRLLPEVYMHHALKEHEWQVRHGKPNTILRDRRGGTTKPLDLLQFIDRINAGDYDPSELGGCGCFAGPEAA